LGLVKKRKKFAGPLRWQFAGPLKWRFNGSSLFFSKMSTFIIMDYIGFGEGRGVLCSTVVAVRFLAIVCFSLVLAS
jgi:hypothetical protein